MLQRRLPLTILFYVITFLCAFSTRGENARNVIRYSNKDGLPDNSINCIAQDKFGFIWIASRSGVCRFDGHRFKTFKLGASVNVVFPQKDTIWIGSDIGLYYYDCRSEKVTKFDSETEWNVTISCPVTGISMNRENNLLIATEGQGLFVADLTNGKLFQKSEHASMLSRIMYLENDHILVGGEEGRIIELDSQGDYIRTIYEDKVGPELKNTLITAMATAGDFFVAGIENKGLLCLDGKGDMVQFSTDGVQMKNPLYILDFQPLNNEKILVGTLRGLVCLNLNSKKVTPPTDKAGKPIQVRFAVNDIFIDKENNIWVATQNDGIYCFPESNFFCRDILAGTESGNPQGEIITAICRGQAERIWIGTEGGSLYYMDSDKDEPHRASLTLTAIKCISAENDILWIGTNYDGLYRWEISSGNIKNYKHDRYDITTISDNCVNSIARDSNGKLYIGTEWGLNYFDELTEKFTYEPRSTNMSSISDIMEDSRDSVWILTHNSGIFRVGLNGKGWTRLLYRNSTNNTIIQTEFLDAAEDKSGIVWFATSSGLLKYDEKARAVRHAEIDGISEFNNTIYSLEFDNHGDLWATSPKGIYRVDIAQNSITAALESSDGIVENHYLEKSSAKCSDGELLFGGVNGITAFNPSSFKQAGRQEQLYITGMLVNNKSISFHDKIRLKRQENNIIFEYSLLCYRNPDKSHYRFMLNGHDTGWSDDTRSTSVSYTSLKPGKYRFQVIGTNGGNFSNCAKSEIQFEVQRSMFLSWWAILLYMTVITTLASFFITQFKKNKIAKGISNKLNFLTDVTHEIRTSVTLIMTPLDKIVKSSEMSVQNRRNLMEIKRGIDNLMDHLNQTLDYRKMQDSGWHINKKFCNVRVILEESVSRFRLLAQTQNISIEQENSGEDLLYEVDPYVFIKIINNLLSNAVKYAEKIVKVTYSAYQAGFRVTVFDDGKAIEENEKNLIFNMFYQSKDSKAGTGIGLALAKRLSEKHGGSLVVAPLTDGACFQLDIPAVSKKNIELTLDSEEKQFDQEEAEADEEKYSVLIVDDNVDLRIMIAEILKDKYIVYQAGDGVSALKKLEELAIDLILSDIIMPEMNGIDFCHTVKSDKRFAHIPLILISAKTDTEDKVSGLESGADDYIEKPFSPDFLLAKISALLSNRKKLEAFYGSLPSVHPKKISTFSKEDIDFIEKLNKALEANIKNSQFHIGDIAEEMFLSQSTFYRRIKTLFKISPNEYIRQFRLQKAAEMLSKGEYTVNNVCFEVGFSSIAYFSSCFKKRFGQSPTQYLASVKDKTDSAKA